MAVGVIKLIINVTVRMIAILHARGCGLWVFTALWGPLFHMAMSPIRFATSAADKVAARVGETMMTEATKEKASYPLLDVEEGKVEGNSIFWHTRNAVLTKENEKTSTM
jgi:hypothetical protein